MNIIRARRNKILNVDKIPFFFGPLHMTASLGLLRNPIDINDRLSSIYWSKKKKYATLCHSFNNFFILIFCSNKKALTTGDHPEPL